MPTLFNTSFTLLRLKSVDNGESGQAILGYNIEPEHQQVSDVQQTDEDILDNQYNPYEKVIEIKEIEESNQNQSQSRSSNPTDQTRPEIKEEISLDINWDSEENYKSRFVRFVSEEKHRRSLELHQINLHWHRFKQEKARLEQEKRNFELASADLAKNIKQFQEILPMAQSLMELGLDLSIVNSWLTTVSQVAQSKNIEIRTAAYQVSEEVQDLLLLGGVKKAIEQKNHELEILGIAVEDRKRTLKELEEVQTELEATKLTLERNKENLTILAELQKVGTLDVILAKVREYDSLTRIINIERFRQTVGQNNNNGQTVNQLPIRARNGNDNQLLSPVDKIWAPIEQEATIR